MHSGYDIICLDILAWSFQRTFLITFKTNPFTFDPILSVHTYRFLVVMLCYLFTGSQMEVIVFIFLIATFTSTHAGTIRNNYGTNKEMDIAAIRSEFFNESSIVYRGQYEIVKINFPYFLMYTHKISKMLLAVEADRDKDGNKIDKGLYVTINDGDKKKLLDSGRDIDGDSLGNVYFAANDGVYTYDAEENIASKYGILNDSVISIAVENSTGVVYALNKNHVLYTVTMNGTKTNIEDRVKDAQEVATDKNDDSLYYYDSGKNAFVLTKDGIVNKITGLPQNKSDIKMVKAPLMMQGMIFIVDSNIYLAHSNGTITVIDEYNKMISHFKPTAYSLEAGLILYYTHEKNVYEFRLFAKIISAIFEQISEKIDKALKEWRNNL